ncbi:MAG: DEAD/DEAH box helicase, partial [Myxococcota bacterium]
LSAACRQARALAVPPEVRQCLDSVSDLFEEPLAAGSHAAAVERALALVAPLRDPAFGDDLLRRSPSCFSGVGPKRSSVLSKRGIDTVLDLLFLLPVRYDDRRSLVRTSELEVGRRATFVARVVSAKSTRRRGRFGRMLEVVVGDEDGTVALKWFRGVEALEPVLREGVQVGVTGDVRRYRFNKEIIHPEVEVLGGPEDKEAESSDRLDSLRRVVPAYPVLEGIPPRTLRRLVERAVEQYGDLVRGFLPPDLVRDEDLPGAAAALQEIHSPPRDVEVEMLDPGRSAAYRRLVLEELYLLEIGLALRRSEHLSRPGIALGAGDRSVPLPAVVLPFALTAAQQRCWNEIRRDLGRPQPMSRLLQGDVGCGKTAVAYLGAAAVAGEGHQAAFMAPTELLAEQHMRSLGRLSESSAEGRRLRVELLTASLPRADREALLERLRGGEVDVLVGTHALLREQVAFASLALVVIDEQHRFGVLQRAALNERGPGGRTPHTLVMTATPIPRTLALTL